jgi:hypothetical protein
VRSWEWEAGMVRGLGRLTGTAAPLPENLHALATTVDCTPTPRLTVPLPPSSDAQLLNDVVACSERDIKPTCLRDVPDVAMAPSPHLNTASVHTVAQLDVCMQAPHPPSLSNLATVQHRIRTGLGWRGQDPSSRRTSKRVEL